MHHKTIDNTDHNFNNDFNCIQRVNQSAIFQESTQRESVEKRTPILKT